MFKCFLPALFALALLMPAVASADEAVLTADEAARIALANNGELAAARIEAGLKEAARLRAGQRANPVLELGGAYADGSENSVSAGISQEFATAGKLRKRAAVAEKDMTTYGWRLKDNERLLVRDVREAYWEAVFAEDSLELAGRSVKLSEELVSVAGERFKADDIPEIDLTLAQVERGRAEAGMLAAEARLAEARGRLFMLMGVPDAGQRFEDTLDTPALEPKKLCEAALSGRPDLKAASASSEKAGADIEAAEAGRWPDVTASLFYERENSTVELADEEIRSGANFFGLKFSVPLPLFDKGEAAVMEARTDKSAALAREDALKRTIEKEVASACRRVEIAKRAASAYSERIIPKLEENLGVVMEAYSLGESGILNVIEERRKFHEVNEGWITARLELAQALAALGAAAGIVLDGGDN